MREGESVILDAFESAGSTDLELLNRAERLAWHKDSVSSDEADAIEHLFDLAAKGPGVGTASGKSLLVC